MSVPAARDGPASLCDGQVLASRFYFLAHNQECRDRGYLTTPNHSSSTVTTIFTFLGLCPARNSLGMYRPEILLFPKTTVPLVDLTRSRTDSSTTSPTAAFSLNTTIPPFRLGLHLSSVRFLFA